MGSGETHASYRAADELWNLLIEIDGMGPTRVSKLMARKRPKLIPILDSRVRQFYESDTKAFWLPLGRALRDEEGRLRIDALRPGATKEGAVTTLRLLDIAIWMSYRGSEPPGVVRKADDDE